MALPSIESSFRPSQYIKVKEKLSISSHLKEKNNIILTRNEEKVDKKSLIFIGKISEHTSTPDLFNSNVWVDISYPYVILIPGRRGTGKSYSLGMIAEGIALTSKDTLITTKDEPQTALIIDTLGQFWQMKHSYGNMSENKKDQLDYLKSWGLKPKTIDNLQVFVPPGKKLLNDWKEIKLNFAEIEIEEIAGVLNLDVYQDRMGQLLNQVYHIIHKKDSDWVGNNNDVSYDIDDFIDCIDNNSDVTDPEKGFVLQTRRALRSRLEDMKKWRIFYEKGFDINEIFKARHVNILNLEGTSEELRNLIVGVLVRKLFSAREKTRNKEKLLEIGIRSDFTDLDIPPGWLLIDEAHEYCPGSGTTASKNILIKYAKEGRSLGLGLVMATQQPSALSPKISSQSEMVISHALAFMSDIKALSDRLVNPTVSEFEGRNESFSFENMIRLLKPGYSLLSTIGTSRSFLLIVRPRITIHGGSVPKMSDYVSTKK